jgi:CHAP domain
MRNWRALGLSLVALLLGTSVATGPGPLSPAADNQAAVSAGTAAVAAAPVRVAQVRPAARTAGSAGTGSGAAGRAAPCAAFPGARPLPGAAGVRPAAWSGDGLVVPACGPEPGGSDRGPAVYPYPGALWTAGYQCVEFAERYLYARYGISMPVVTNGDQVAAHYAASFAALFMVVRNGTPHRAPRAGDVLSLSSAAGFDSASGGHTAVVQSAAVDSGGDGTVTVVEENGSAAGVTVLPVTGWTVRYPGFRYVEWLTATGQAG